MIVREGKVREVGEEWGVHELGNERILESKVSRELGAVLGRGYLGIGRVGGSGSGTGELDTTLAVPRVEPGRSDGRYIREKVSEIGFSPSLLTSSPS